MCHWLKLQISRVNREGVDLRLLGTVVIIFSAFYLLCKWLFSIPDHDGGAVIARGIYIADAGGSEFFIACIIIGFLFLILDLFVQRYPVELLKKTYDYRLYLHQHRLFLAVVHGSVGIYEQKIKLTHAERQLFWMNGQEYIDTLVHDIRTHAQKYRSRFIQ